MGQIVAGIINHDLFSPLYEIAKKMDTKVKGSKKKGSKFKRRGKPYFCKDRVVARPSEIFYLLSELESNLIERISKEFENKPSIEKIYVMNSMYDGVIVLVKDATISNADLKKLTKDLKERAEKVVEVNC